MKLIIVAYLVMTSYFFMNWLKFFKRSPKLSPEEMFLSIVILLIATIFWPIVVPISSLELLKAGKLQLNNMVSVVLAMFVLSLLTASGLAVFNPAVPQVFSYLFTDSH